ncbi:FAD-binding protein [Modestobacter sp. VKM Ac-2977]|uniref:FAD-binding oxidoreductase n=1 Tax=Modestobacter sp. VKM Ac-2977 TaxID=3004131 RepID=UPI0022AA99C8|nr:FAD-linked oxidase C-terminal domain-containing protein [Modestobacter sp. VKM Ac-2977]MCZ2821801.1 FAD-binding protein [Modestobacter sp. VKM Ac-2977]
MTALTTTWVRELQDALGPDSVLTDPDVTAAYARDQAMLAEAGLPAAVALPRSTEEVSAVLRLASRHGVPVVPRGAGSGLVGAANAVDGCITLALTRMDAVLEVAPADRLAVVQAGVVNKTLRDAVREHGLFYPPDPASYDWCTLGGNLAMNSGGLCCVKYGVTTDYVLGLEVVLADGRVLRTGRRTVKGVAGYDLARLFVGSEGTLGVITEATLALRPAPQPPVTLVASFGTSAQTGQVVERVVTSGLVPSMLEVMDRTCIRAVDDLMRADLDRDAAALLLAQSDSGGDVALAEIAALTRLCEEAGADFVHSTDDPAEGDLLMTARRMALPALERLGSSLLLDDVAVPRSRVATFVDGCDAIAATAGLVVGVVGHAGDGNMHPTVVFDGADPDQCTRAYAAFDAILELGLSLGGTITGEHGVGTIKADWLEREIGQVSLSVHQAIKHALDPAGLLNPGKMFRRASGGDLAAVSGLIGA